MGIFGFGKKDEARVNLATTEKLIDELSSRGYSVSAKIEKEGKRR